MSVADDKQVEAFQARMRKEQEIRMQHAKAEDAEAEERRKRFLAGLFWVALAAVIILGAFWLNSRPGPDVAPSQSCNADTDTGC
jgi:hypothetical protein